MNANLNFRAFEAVKESKVLTSDIQMQLLKLLLSEEIAEGSKKITDEALFKALAVDSYLSERVKIKQFVKVEVFKLKRALTAFSIHQDVFQFDFDTVGYELIVKENQSVKPTRKHRKTFRLDDAFKNKPT